MHLPPSTFRLLPIDQLEIDIDQPRTDPKDEERQAERVWLLHSILDFGVLEALHVMELSPRRFRVIDGTRRYYCARQLGVSKIPCMVHPEMTPAEVSAFRVEFQETFLPLTAPERLASLSRLKEQLYGKKHRRGAQAKLRLMAAATPASETETII